MSVILGFQKLGWNGNWIVGGARYLEQCKHKEIQNLVLGKNRFDKVCEFWMAPP